MTGVHTKRSAVITGLGPVSALGVGIDPFVTALREERCCIAPLERFADNPDEALLGVDRPDFDVDTFLKGRKTYLDPSSELALAAIALAIRDADLDEATLGRAGLCLGSAHGPTETMGLFIDDLVAKGPRFVKPILFPHTYLNTAVSLAAIEFDMHGPHLNLASGFTAAAQAIAAGIDLVRDGRADVMVAGGFEALSEYLLWGYESAGLLSLCDEVASLGGPFGRERDGFVPAAAAGALVIEARDHARARGARVYAELAGVGMSSTGANEAPAAGGLARAMRAALREGRVRPDGVSLVAAAANGSIEGDHDEAAAIRSACAREQGSPPVTAFKARTGEAMGAGGALQLIAAGACLARQAAPVTLDPAGVDKSLGLHVDAAPAPDTILVNTTDPGGAAVSILLREENASA